MLSDEALYEALLNGDLRAFDTLYARYERHLFGFLRKHLADVHEAEDVLHEAFLAILRDRAGARAARSLRAWLFQVARHLCLNRQRSARRATRALEKEARSPVEFIVLKRNMETAEDEPAPSWQARERLRLAVARELRGTAPARSWRWWERPLALGGALAVLTGALFMTYRASISEAVAPRALSRMESNTAGPSSPQ